MKTYTFKNDLARSEFLEAGHTLSPKRKFTLCSLNRELDVYANPSYIHTVTHTVTTLGKFTIPNSAVFELHFPFETWPEFNLPPVPLNGQKNLNSPIWKRRRSKKKQGRLTAMTFLRRRFERRFFWEILASRSSMKYFNSFCVKKARMVLTLPLRSSERVQIMMKKKSCVANRWQSCFRINGSNCRGIRQFAQIL